jgi:hypothetical protein
MITSDGRITLFIRCQDANGNEKGVGNENVDEFAVSFCVDKSPDTTQPIIDDFSIPSGSYVGYKQDNVNITAYINEPAECKWSTQSKNFEDMENTMQCDTYGSEINAMLEYECHTKITGVNDRESNKYYFRCKDQPGAEENKRNVNTQSTEYTLLGSQPLDILSAKPNGTISSSTDVATIDLLVETSNGAQENGNATCEFSTNAKTGYISMFESGSYYHKQTLTLGNGNYTYYFRCFDAGGNSATNFTNFNVLVDKQTPRVARAYQEEGLKIVTDEDAECVYSTTTCNYQFGDGIKMIYSKADVRDNHFAEWKENAVYYIKCQDDYKNQPDPSKCSAVVKAIDLTNTDSTTVEASGLDSIISD